MKKKHKPKPNFFIIGAAKCGNGSLAALLEAHPEVGIAMGEHPNFFSYDDKYKLGWKRYLRLFEHCLGKKAVGDASRSYSRVRYHPQVANRIHEHVKHAKIIYMVRHPLQRMVSAYVERMSYPSPPNFASINDAVKGEPMIVDSSRYWEVFDLYRKIFSESQVKVIWYEDYLQDTRGVFQEVCRFLEISDSMDPDLSHPRANPFADASESALAETASGISLNTVWETDTRKWIVDQILEDNYRFLEHFGKPRNLWGDLLAMS
jgi:hypothetical protein